jgi:hypothetical protein
VAHRIAPRELAGVLLQSDRIGEREMLLMRRPDLVEVRVQAEVQAIVLWSAKPSASEASSATLHPALSGLSTSTLTAIGCKRGRGSESDSDSVSEEEERLWSMTDDSTWRSRVD